MNLHVPTSLVPRVYLTRDKCKDATYNFSITAVLGEGELAWIIQLERWPTRGVDGSCKVSTVLQHLRMLSLEVLKIVVSLPDEVPEWHAMSYLVVSYSDH